MGAIASQITSLMIVYSTIYSDADQRKHQSSASLAFVRVIHRGPVNSPHKWLVTRKMFPFDDVIISNSNHQANSSGIPSVTLGQMRIVKPLHIFTHSVFCSRTRLIAMINLILIWCELNLNARKWGKVITYYDILYNIFCININVEWFYYVL